MVKYKSTCYQLHLLFSVKLLRFESLPEFFQLWFFSSSKFLLRPHDVAITFFICSSISLSWWIRYNFQQFFFKSDQVRLKNWWLNTKVHVISCTYCSLWSFYASSRFRNSSGYGFFRRQNFCYDHMTSQSLSSFVHAISTELRAWRNFSLLVQRVFCSLEWLSFVHTLLTSHKNDFLTEIDFSFLKFKEKRLSAFVSL